MTSPNQTKRTPAPAIIVYGAPTGPELTQASWFRAEDIQAAKTAAEALKFSVLELKTEAERALTVGVHEGVLKGSGRMIVGSVDHAVYRRIEEYARTASGDDASPQASTTEIAAGRMASEQNMNHTTAGPAPSAPASKDAGSTLSAAKTVATSSPASPPGKPEKPAPVPDPWDGLRVGAHVIGKYWYSTGEANGWWVGVITAIDGNDFIIRWPDEPRTPPLKIERRHVAILHPAFDVAREWDRKR